MQCLGRWVSDRLSAGHMLRLHRVRSQEYQRINGRILRNRGGKIYADAVDSTDSAQLHTEFEVVGAIFDIG